MSKKRNLFAGLICLILTFVCLVSCAPVTLSPELAAKKQAETDAQEVLGKLVWDEEDRTAIVSSLSFATQNKNYPGVTVTWSSSEEDIISTTGKVNRPDSDDPRNVLVGEDLLATVIITATVVAEYSWEDNGTQSASTEPISKQFTFTVLAKPEGTDTGTIEDVKLRAWNYIYVEQGVDKALVSNSNVTYNVLLSGVVTAKLNADGATKGFMLHDGTDGIYVYGDNTKVEVGDSVEVIGGVYSYYGSLQVGSNVSVAKSNVKVTLPEYNEVTPQSWEDQNKGLGDDVIGHLGGDLYKVAGFLNASYNATTKDEFCIVDAYTGETSWIYYKSYNAEMKAQLEAYVGKYVEVTGVGYDRDSRIVKNHLLWNGGIEEVEAPAVDDQTQAEVALSQISLKDAYDEDFELSAAGAWEVVSGTGVEIAEGVAKVTRADEDQVVVLKVTVTVGEATASKELTVTIKAIVKETPKHAGTQEDPYTASDALIVAGALAQGETSEEKYYVKGEIVAIKEVSTSYGNATFTISDGKNEFICYRAYYLAGEKFTAEDQIKVGDNVVVCGQFTNYNGTLEFAAKCYIDSFVEEESNDPYGCISIEEAIALGAAQEHNTYTEEKYYVKGTVTGFYNTTYGNFYLTDGTNQICVYGLYSADGTTRYDAMEVKPVDGDEIIVYGVLGQYNGNPQFKNAWFVEFVEDEPVEEDPYGCISIEEAIALGAAQEHNTYTEEKYYVKGTVTGFYNTTYGNFYLTDGTNQICVYGLYSADGTTRYDAMDVKPVDGDEIIVYGALGQYNGNPQFKNAWLVEMEGAEETPHEHEYVDGKCECGETDPDYVAPEVSGSVVEFDFTTGTTTMDSAYNSAEAEMTVNGITFGYLQMKASGYSGSNFLMFCKSTDAHLYNKTAFASAIVKVEVYIPSGASTKAGYFLSLHKEAASGNITSSTSFVGANASFSIEASAEDGFYYFNLSSDSTTTKNGQVAKIVVTLANGTVVTPPAHEHVYVEGKCECGETDPDYVAPETPSTGLVEGQAYKLQLVQTNAGKTVYFTGAMSGYYYATSEDVNAGVDVYAEVVEGGYNLYFLDADGAKHYMGIVASGTYVNAVFDNEKTVFVYSETLKTVTATVNGSEYVFGTRNDNTYTTIGANKTSYDPFTATLVIVNNEVVHEHVACETCGLCTDAECTGTDAEKCAGHVVEPVAGATVTLTANVTANYNASAEGEDVTSCTSLSGSEIFTLTVGAPTATYKNQVYFATSGQIRLYSDASGVGNTLTIKSTKKIVSIAITYEAANRSGATFTIDGTTFVGATDVTEETIDVNGYSITIANNKTSGQVRLVSVVITYEA